MPLPRRPNSAEPLNTRVLAADVLVRVLSGGESLSTALADSLPAALEPKDRALTQALAYGVSRWFWELDFLLNRLVPKPIKEPYVKALALLGLFQLRHMRVKAHAAVAETVAAAHRRQWAKPLLNGVLRNYLRQQTALEAALASDIGASTAHPRWLIERLGRDWPDEFATLLRQNNLPAPMTLRVNRLRVTRDAYLDQLRALGIAAYPGHVARDAIIVERPMAVERLPGFADGLVSVQDEAPQLAAELLDLKPGQRVLDVCAAPGGKTVHLLETCPALQQVVAVDISPKRAVLIRENLARSRVDAAVIVADAAADTSWWDGRPFDRILLDAPCSGTGVIRRHPDIKLLRKRDDIAQASARQRGLLQQVWPLLQRGGRLLYATCSVLREENEFNIDWFLTTQADAREIRLPDLSPRAVSHGCQVLTGDRGMDGFYYAGLAKTG